MTGAHGGGQGPRPELGPGTRRIQVLFIAGSGRSGSTLLELMLGQIPGFRSVGELSLVWPRGNRQDELCGCGERFAECPFWRQVGEKAFGGWDRLDPDEVVALRRSVDRTRFIPLMVARGASSAYERRLERYSRLLARLYAGIADVSGDSIIVDSTKHPSTGFLLRRVPGVDIRVVHLVRDSRGVAYSWTKEVQKPEVTNGAAYLDRYRPARMAVRWVMYNSLVHALRSDRHIPSLFLRYEDMVREPRPSIRRIAALVGQDAGTPELSAIGDGWVNMTADHNVAGNPVRFQRDRMPLRVDEEWRHRMTSRDRAVVSAITLPLLAAYGYVGKQVG